MQQKRTWFLSEMGSWLVGAAVYFAEYWQNHWRGHRTSFLDLSTRMTEMEGNGPLCGSPGLQEDVSYGQVNDQCRKGPKMVSFNRKRCSIETRSYRHSHYKSLTSLDSCVLALQHVKMEEYISTSLPLPPQTAISIPLILTDGSQIISTPSGDFLSGLNGTMDTERQFHSQRGPDVGALPFGIGFCIGIISSYIGNRREMSELRGLLKRTENVVQDLRDELEMVTSVTVKEIANEKYGSRETQDDLFYDRATDSSSVGQNFNNTKHCHGRESYDDKVEGSSESMSQIEAELEAELQRLGLNMKASNPESRLSDLVELDPDFVADFAEGKLSYDMVNVRALVKSVSNKDRLGTSTTHSKNYAVSPWELSLRLHEVIQSKLEKRIKELETALRNSQGKVKLMELAWKISNMNGNIMKSSIARPIL